MTDLEQYNAAALHVRSSPKRRAEAWREGKLWWLLDYLQFQLYQRFYSRPPGVSAEADRGEVLVWDIARRVGKTYALLVLALECAIRGGGRSVKYAAKTKVDVSLMIRPSLRKLLLTCPEKMRPKSKSPREGDGLIIRHKGGNDSFIDIAGCDDGRYENLRGQEAHLWVVDEGGFVPDLTTVVDDVLWPQTWTTKGPGIIASSPPDTPGHAFQAYYLAAKARGASARHTFWESPRYTEAEKWSIVDQGAAMKRMTRAEFMKSTVYLREFLAEFVLEETRAVLPGFSETLAAKLTRPEESTPLFTDWYTLIDLGGSRDPTGIAVGYWDFRRRKLRIQRGVKLLRPSTKDIAREVKALERETFGIPWSLTDPAAPASGDPARELRGLHFRIMDDDLGIVRRDLAQLYSLATTTPRKDDKDAALMDLRDALGSEEVEGEIEFDPAAAEVLAQCQAALWNKQHTEYERVEGFGHFDLVDCLLYGHRNVVKNKGRVPHLYGIDTFNTRVPRDQPPPVSPGTLALRRAFGGNL
jgi:hypothetical protein